MSFLDRFKRKKAQPANTDSGSQDDVRRLNGSDFTFIRTDTAGQEILQPPNDGRDQNLLSPQPSVRSSRRSHDVFRSDRSRSDSASSQTSHGSRQRLSQRLHLSRQAESSDYVPENLPAITGPDPTDEAQWEARATMLAGQNEFARSRPASPVPSEGMPQTNLEPGSTGRKRSSSSSQAIDDDIQLAISLHEEGKFEQSTKLFGRLADPEGANNPLSQILYGLALRHGWGCQPDPANAVRYLSTAASNSAAVEELALQAGKKKGGAAKGELVMAIFELANCFSSGWGIKADPFAAKHYYETAANLGDSDAMNEAARCYLKGFGCEKDKYTAAQYYRRAEQAGNKTLGNTWIWKPKYDFPRRDR